MKIFILDLQVTEGVYLSFPVSPTAIPVTIVLDLHLL